MVHAQVLYELVQLVRVKVKIPYQLAEIIRQIVDHVIKLIVDLYNEVLEVEVVRHSSVPNLVQRITDQRQLSTKRGDYTSVDRVDQLYCQL